MREFCRIVRSGYSVDDLLTVGIIHTVKSSDLVRELKAAGWVLDRIVGSHHVFRNPATGAHVTVPHPKKDLGKGLVHKIRKQAGLS